MFEQDQVYYHVTLLDNVYSIREKGLVPQIGTLSKETGEEEAGVFLFPSEEDVDATLMNWLGEWYDDEYGDDCKLAILRICLPADAQLYDSTVQYEKICKSVIPPECISFFDEYWNEISVPKHNPLDIQIRSATVRAAESHPTSDSDVKTKAPDSER